MTNDETPNGERMMKPEGLFAIDDANFVIRISVFFRHSSFGFRHSLDPTTDGLQRLRNPAVLANAPEVNGDQARHRQRNRNAV